MTLETSANSKNDAEPICSYDVVPYESQPFSRAHPDALATIATLFGMNPAPVKQCRVLELGCASGGNIMPMALNLPESQFLGIDFSLRQINEGKESVQALGLKNIELRQMNIMDIDRNLGNFDYIVVHGVFSWVSDALQEKILKVCNELLSPNGVAYISYNTFPGWHFRGMVREMMLYHTAHLSDPQARCQEARALLDFLSLSVPSENDAYGTMLASEVAYLNESRNDYLLHDYLEGLNKPLYFCQFVEQAARHQMQYLGDAEFSTMLTSSFPSQVAEMLRQMSNQLLRTEQYIDFVRNRTFRRSLLCHEEVILNRKPGLKNIRAFYISCPAKPAENIAVRSTEMQTFQLPKGNYYSSSKPLVKAAFQHLCAIYPDTVNFAQLVNIARSQLAPDFIQYRGSIETNSQILSDALLTAYAHDVVVLSTEPAQFICEVSKYPMATALVRYQAGRQAWVTNQLHDALFLDQFRRNLAALLDGSRNKTQLLNDLRKLVNEGQLVVLADGKTVEDDQQLTAVLAESMDKALSSFARTAVLIA